jgi:antirestriction protein ArdC
LTENKNERNGAIPAPFIPADVEPRDRVKAITAKLEEGIKNLFDSDKFKEYLNTMSKFHNYSFSNTLLIAMQKPGASLVAGFNTWKNQFGRYVNKGEKGITILAPTPYKVKKEVEKIDKNTGFPVLGKDGKPVTEEVEETVPYFKSVYVYDVSQTNGREIPSLGADELSGNVQNYEKLFEALKTVSPVSIEFEKIMDGGKGYYHHKDKRIAIKEGMSELQNVKTAIHEIAHAKLHDRDLVKADIAEKKDRKTGEVEAESIAYTVCQHYGIDTSDYSFGYIAAWSSGKETPELKSSLETIRATANEIINKIDEQFLDKSKEKTQEQSGKPEQTEKQEQLEKSPNIIGNTKYADIEDKNYFKYKNPVAAAIAARLEAEGVAFSGRAGKEFTTLTIGGADVERFKAVEKAVKTELAVSNAYETGLNGENPGKSKKETANGIIGNTKYSDIPDKKYLAVDNAIAVQLSFALEQKGLKFSGKVSDNNKTVFTVSQADFETARAVETELIQQYKTVQVGINPQKSATAQKSDIIGNAKYSEIDDKKYFKIDTDIALKVASELESQGVKFSGRIGGDKTTLTVGNADVPAYRVAYNAVKTAETELKVADKMPEITEEQLSDRIAKALEYGKEAFLEGKKCVPAHDEKFLDLIKGLNIGEGGDKIADSWLKGWTTENLSAEISDKTYTFGIYQVNDDNKDIRFATLKTLEDKGITVNHSAYDLVFTAETNSNGRTKEQILEDIYAQFNTEHPENFKGRSLSVSDVVVMETDDSAQPGNDGQTVHYCDNIGFREIPEFFVKIEKTAEVQNTQPSVADLEAQVNNGESISVMDLAKAVKAEKSEKPAESKKSPSISERLKAGKSAEIQGIPKPHEPKKDFPEVYANNLAYAREHGEIEAYKISKTLNIECAAAIDGAIRANSKPGPMSGTQYVDTEQALKDVVKQYGAERVKSVTAAVVADQDWDGRLSNTNKSWAKSVDNPVDKVYVRTHLSIFDGFVNKVRDMEKILDKKPDIHDKIAAKKSEPSVKNDGVKKSKGDVEI